MVGGIVVNSGGTVKEQSFIGGLCCHGGGDGQYFMRSFNPNGWQAGWQSHQQSPTHAVQSLPLSLTYLVQGEGRERDL